MEFAFTETWGRRVCWILAVVDAALGGGAALFPATYLSVVHPDLPVSQHPSDWVVRTAILWLMFCALEVCAAVSSTPARWFFLVAVLRLMEVPADIAYGVLARGVSSVSRFAILIAPVANLLAGAFLLGVIRTQSRLRDRPKT